MKMLESLRSRLIDKIMITKNEQLLVAIAGILNSTTSEEKLILDTYQIEMLAMSQKDIENGDLISEEALNI